MQTPDTAPRERPAGLHAVQAVVAVEDVGAALLCNAGSPLRQAGEGHPLGTFQPAKVPFRSIPHVEDPERFPGVQAGFQIGGLQGLDRSHATGRESSRRTGRPQGGITRAGTAGPGPLVGSSLDMAPVTGCPQLEARQVSKAWTGGVRALDRADLQVQRGETVALVGRSGCGKTTLLRLFNRLVEADSGEVRVAGRLIAGADPVELRRHTGYVPQEGGLIPHWTVARNVGLVPELFGWTRARRQDRTAELLQLVGLPPAGFAARYPAELSGGQRQRVAFARALAADPEVVLLDEPFGALDALTRASLQREFLRLKRSLGKTMLFVTHDLTEAFRLADRVAVMAAGRLLRCAQPAELRSEPGHPQVAELLQGMEFPAA